MLAAKGNTHPPFWGVGEEVQVQTCVVHTVTTTYELFLLQQEQEIRKLGKKKKKNRRFGVQKMCCGNGLLWT